MNLTTFVQGFVVRGSLGLSGADVRAQVGVQQTGFQAETVKGVNFLGRDGDVEGVSDGMSVVSFKSSFEFAGFESC
jgi:hypothetical protein